MKYIIFDYDGTLHNSIKIYKPAFMTAYDYLVDNGYDITYGARPLKRLLSRTVETSIAKVLINNEVKFGMTLVVDYHDGHFDITKKEISNESI